MINPNIALSYNPTNLGIETPTQVMTNTQQLTNMQNAGKLQQAQLTGANQENQQREIGLQTLAATNQAIQASTKTNPDGTVAIDHQAVARTLAQGGFGAAAQQYLDAQQKRDEALTKLSSDKLDLADKQHGQMIEDLAQVLGASGDGRAQLWKKKIQKYQGMKTEGADQLNPDQAPDDATLQTLLMTAKEGRQVIQSITAQKAAETQAKREADYQTQLATQSKREQDWYEINSKKNDINAEKAQKGRYVSTKETDDDRNPMVLDTWTGKLVTDPDIQVRDKPKSGGNRGSRLTANGEAVQGRFETKQINDARADLDDIHAQRTAIGNAMKVQDGKDFRNPLTKKTETMDADTRADLQDQLTNATNKGQRIMRQWGGNASDGVIGANEFSDLGGAKPAKSGATSGRSSTTPAKSGGSKGWKYVPGQGLVAK